MQCETTKTTTTWGWNIVVSVLLVGSRIENDDCAFSFLRMCICCFLFWSIGVSFSVFNILFLEKSWRKENIEVWLREWIFCAQKILLEVLCLLFEERVFHVFGVLTFQNEKLGLAFRVYSYYRRAVLFIFICLFSFFFGIFVIS